MDWSQIAKTAAPALGDLLGKTGGMFGNNWKNPGDSSMDYLNQIPDEVRKYLEPYMNAGQQALPGMQKEFGESMSNPGGRANEIGEGYRQSPGFDFAMKQALKARQNAASAGGFAGTPAHEQYAMQTATGLADQDYNQWMQNALNLHGQGVMGNMGLYQTGAQSANNMAQMIQDALTKQAENKWSSQQEANKQDNSGSIWGTIGNLAGTLIPMFL